MMNTGLDMPVAGWIQTMGKEVTSVGVYPRQAMKERARYGTSSYSTFAEARGQIVRILRASGFQAADVGSMESPPDEAVVVIRSRRPSCEREVASLLPRHL